MEVTGEPKNLRILWSVTSKNEIVRQSPPITLWARARRRRMRVVLRGEWCDPISRSNELCSLDGSIPPSISGYQQEMDENISTAALMVGLSSAWLHLSSLCFLPVSCNRRRTLLLASGWCLAKLQCSLVRGKGGYVQNHLGYVNLLKHSRKQGLVGGLRVEPNGPKLLFG